MKRRGFLQSTMAATMLPKLGRASGQAPTEGQATIPTAIDSAMRASVGNLTYSGSTAPALVVNVALPWRLVCWAEAQYVPFWDINGVWVTSEWLETLGTKTPYDFEPISDKALRYTHVEAAEIGPARVVVHWRYALCDTHEKVFHDNTTAEEFHTIYPDGVTVRKTVGYPGTGEPREGQPKMWEVGEQLLILPQGSRVEESLSPDGMTISNLEGASYQHKFLRMKANSNFEKQPPSEITRWLCQVYPASKTWSEFIWSGGLPSGPQPFIIVPNRQELFPHTKCHLCGGDHPGTLLWQQPFLWKHYPQFHGEYEIGIPATEADLAHRSVSTSYVSVLPYTHPQAFAHPDPSMPFDPHWNPPRGTTWLMLEGVHAGGADYPRRLAASWLNPAQVDVHVGRYLGYEPAERAYRFSTADRRVDFELRPKAGSAQINPVVVIENWTFGNPRITLDQHDVETGSYAVSWTGNRLIVWFKREVTSPLRVAIAGWPVA